MSVCHVRVVTSDRVIHHFDSVEAASSFVNSGKSKPLAPRGQSRIEMLEALTKEHEIDSIALADLCDSTSDVINGVLRKMVMDGVIAISKTAASGRRFYRITAEGRQELEDIKAGMPVCPRKRLQHRIFQWMRRPGQEFWSGDLEAAFSLSRTYANMIIKQAVVEGHIVPSGNALGKSHRQYYQAAPNLEPVTK